jgi:hypothetical protein
MIDTFYNYWLKGTLTFCRTFELELELSYFFSMSFIKVCNNHEAIQAFMVRSNIILKITLVIFQTFSEVTSGKTTPFWGEIWRKYLSPHPIVFVFQYNYSRNAQTRSCELYANEFTNSNYFITLKTLNASLHVFSSHLY